MTGAKVQRQSPECSSRDVAVRSQGSARPLKPKSLTSGCRRRSYLFRRETGFLPRSDAAVHVGHFGIPISCSVAAASAERPPDAQCRMTRLLGSNSWRWFGVVGSAQNSSMPRGASTAPGTDPVCSRSAGSRRSTRVTWPSSISVLTCSEHCANQPSKLDLSGEQLGIRGSD